MTTPPNATIHKYRKGDLAAALVRVMAEAARVHEDGYDLVGYQVVESERCITTLYKKMGPRTPPSGVSLIGE